MSVLDNLLVGRTLKYRSSPFEAAFRIGRYRREARIQLDATRNVAALLELTAYQDVEVGKLPYGLQKARRAWTCARN